jgi:AraC-like DNA-binding protein
MAEKFENETKKGIEFRDTFFRHHPMAESLVELFDFLPTVYFYAKDTKHRYVGMNLPTLNDVFGLESLDELLGKTDSEFQPPALAQAYHAEDRRVMDGGQTIANQVWLVPHVRGTPRWYVSTKTPIRDPQGNVIGVAGVMYPIETPELQAAYFDELLPVVKYIDAHYTQPISMKAMADLAQLSPSHFNQRFRTILRMTPSEYVLSRRVQLAQQLLTESSTSIINIAASVGFYDQSHFTKRFHRITGLTPSAYRAKFRN